MHIPPPGRFAHLVTGSPVIVDSRGYLGTRTEHTVEHATQEVIAVNGEEFRRCDGRRSGSALGEHRLPCLVVS